MRNILACAITFWFWQAAHSVELALGVITLVSVKGQVELTFDGETRKARNRTQVAERVSVTVHPRGRAILIFANAASILLGENTRIHIDRFRIAAFDRPLGSIYEMKWEPSFSYTRLRLQRGEMVCETRNLREESSFVIEMPVGVVEALRNDTDRGTTFWLRFTEAAPAGAVWKGRIRLSTRVRAPEIIGGDRHIFFDPGLGSVVAYGLEWDYVRMFEERVALIRAAQQKFRLE